MCETVHAQKLLLHVHIRLFRSKMQLKIIIHAIEMTHEQENYIGHAVTVAHSKRTVIKITYTLHILYIIIYSILQNTRRIKVVKSTCLTVA